MKIKKNIKKIVSLGMGAVMLGVTVFSAYASNNLFLNNIQQDGLFNGKIVIGKQASVEDVIGATDMSAYLQSVNVKKELVSQQDSSTITTIKGDVFDFSDANNMLEINEYIGEVKSTLSENELEFLEEQSVQTKRGKTDVKQYIRLPEDGLKIVYEYNDDLDKDIDMLSCEGNNKEILTYELQFSDGLKSYVYESNYGNTKVNDGESGYLNDLNNKEVNILGTSYSITEGYINSDNELRLTLMGGSNEQTMDENEKKTIVIDETEYDVEVLIIADGTDDATVKFIVNGETTYSLYEGDTFTLKDDTVLGVKDIMSNEGSETNGSDKVTFYLGANKLEIDSNDISVKDETTNGEIQTILTYTSNEVKISNIKYKLYVDCSDIEIFENESLSNVIEENIDMLTDNWDISYNGLDYEEDYKVKILYDDGYELELVNNDNEELLLPLKDLAKKSSVVVDDYIVLTDKNQGDDAVSHLISLDKIDDDEIVFRNEISNEKINVDLIDNSGELIIGGDDFNFNVNGNDVKFTDTKIKNGLIIAKQGIKFNYNIDSKILNIEVPDNLFDNYVSESFSLNLSDDDVETTGFDFVKTNNDDVKKSLSRYGIVTEKNNDEEDEFVLSIPTEQVKPKVLITGNNVEISQEIINGDSIYSDVVIPLEEYTTVFDDEINHKIVNSVVIGGPCANTVSAELLNIGGPGTNDCYESFPVKSGEAILKLIEHEEKVSFLIAGYTAKDTRNAIGHVIKNGINCTDAVLNNILEIDCLDNQEKNETNSEDNNSSE